jgi:hypothetical protein
MWERGVGLGWGGIFYQRDPNFLIHMKDVFWGRKRDGNVAKVVTDETACIIRIN